MEINLDVKILADSVPPKEREKLRPAGMKLSGGHGDPLETPAIQVSLKAQLAFSKDQYESDVAPYELSAEVRGVATWDKEKIEDEIVLAWAKQGAAYALFPYLRALVSDLTARTGYPPVVLPLMILPTMHLRAGEEGKVQLEEQSAP